MNTVETTSISPHSSNVFVGRSVGKRHNWSYKFKNSMQGGLVYCLNCGITKFKGLGGHHYYYVDSAEHQYSNPCCCQQSEETIKKRIELFNRLVKEAGW